eukprot:3585668-Amphidinium_carterae.1
MTEIAELTTIVNSLKTTGEAWAVSTANEYKTCSADSHKFHGIVHAWGNLLRVFKTERDRDLAVETAKGKQSELVDLLVERLQEEGGHSVQRNAALRFQEEFPFGQSDSNTSSRKQTTVTTMILFQFSGGTPGNCHPHTKSLVRPLWRHYVGHVFCHATSKLLDARHRS